MTELKNAILGFTDHISAMEKERRTAGERLLPAPFGTSNVSNQRTERSNPPRFHRLEFPTYDGKEDPLGWLQRCDQFFRG